MRHKYVTRYDPDDWDKFFQELKDKDYVAEKYEYTDCARTKKNTAVGTILSVTDKGRKFTAIVSNTGNVRTNYIRCRFRKTYTKTIFKLTDEGVQYLKELIVIERI